MATSFEKIYELNNTIKTDTRLYGKPTNLIYQLYFSYLEYAISTFQYDCYKNITDITPFSQIEFSFMGDGITNEFVLDTIPPSIIFYISIDDVEIKDFIYNEIDNKITLKNIPSINSKIYISSYIIGQFNQVDLNLRELQILSEGMIVPWLKQQRNFDQLLNQMVYSSDFKIYSQAEHISQVNNSIKQSENRLRELINEYTFKESPSLNGLGGGLI